MRLLAGGLLCLLLAGGAAAQTAAGKQDLAKLQGHWSMVSATRDGSALPKQMVQSFKRVASGDTVTVTTGSTVFMKAHVTLDPAKHPKAVDYAVTDGIYKGAKQLGIYEVQGTTARFCFSVPGGHRPTDFTAKSGSLRTLSVWKRDTK